MEKYLYFCFLTLFCSYLCQGQKLVPLHQAKGGYLDNVERSLILPQLNLKQDANGHIFYNNKIIFQPKDDYKYSIYQLFNDQFLVISALSSKAFGNNLRYVLPKRKILIIDLKIGTKVYEDDINNRYIYDIYYEGDNVLIIELAREVERIVIE